MPDQDSTSVDFLAWLHEYTSGPVELRAIKDEGGATSTFTRDPDVVQTFVAKFDGPGRGVYFGVATRTAGTARGSRADCTELPAVWADIDCIARGIDFEDALAALRTLPMPPSAIVHSGRGLHAYWRLSEPLDVSAGEVEHDDAIVAVLRQLAGVCCGDLKVCDIARVLRLPGTTNTKGDEPVVCRVIEVNDRVYDFGEIVEWLDWQRAVIQGMTLTQTEGHSEPTNPFLAAAERFGFKPPLDVQAALEAMSYEAPGENSIHQTQLRVSASMASHGHEDDEIVAVLLEATRVAAGPVGAFWNWTREERAIRGMIASARVKFPKAAPPKASKFNESSADTGSEPAPPNVVSIAEARSRQQARPKEVGKDAPLIARIGEATLDFWQDHRPMLARIDSELWCYGAGFWTPFDDKLKARLRADIQTMFRTWNADPKTSHLNAVERYVLEHDRLDRDGSFTTADPVVVGRSTTLVLETGKVEPHSPDHLARYAIDCEHDQLADCPRWKEFLDSAFSNLEQIERAKVVGFLQEWFGALLAMPRKREMRKALILYGPSRTGKTQILRVARALLGHSNHDLRLSQLEKDQFALSHIHMKRGWICDDAIGPQDDLASEIFKQIVTGDPCSVRYPGGKAFDHAFAIPVGLSANDLPRVRDTSDGVYNRLCVVRMGVVVPEGHEGHEEIYETVERDELGGVFQWALTGRRRLLERRRYDIPETIKSEISALKYANNPVRDFVDKMFVADPGYCFDRRDAWCAWCAYLEDEGDDNMGRWGKQTFFRLFGASSGCRTAQNSAGKARFVGGRLTDQAIDMIKDFEARYPLDKRKHGSGGGPASINQLWGEYEKNARAQSTAPKPKTRF